MAHGARICPYCGGLNSADAERCNRCERKLPGPLVVTAVDLFNSAFGTAAPLTNLFIALCVIVFVLTSLDARPFVPPDEVGRALFMGGYPSSTLLRFGALVGNAGRLEPWRYLSAVFFHFGVLHIAFNLLALRDIGGAFEQRVRSSRLAVVFVVTGVVGFLSSEVWYTFVGEHPGTGGASGAIFGLMGATIAYEFAKGDPAWKRMLIRVGVYAVILGYVLPLNNAAHFGGFVCGAPIGYLLCKESRPWRRARVLGWIASLLVAASIASVLLSTRSPYWRELREAELQRRSG